MSSPRQLMIHVPTARMRPPVSSVAPIVRKPEKSRLVLGILDNSKPNFDRLAGHFIDLLLEHGHVLEVIRKAKPAATFGAQPALLDELAAQCDIVLTGSAD